MKISPELAWTNYRDLLSEKIEKMREELLYNVCLSSGVLPTGQTIQPAVQLNADGSMGDDTSIFESPNETTIVHFFGLRSSEYWQAKKLQPDDEGYLPLKNHPLRLKYKPVKHLVQMDTLDKLIERSKRIVNAMYKILGEVESQDPDFERLSRKIIHLDYHIWEINQG